MTTRLKGFVVAFEQDIRKDDAEMLRQAILAMRNVAAVDPVPVDFNDHINRTKIKQEIGVKLYEVLKEF